jgi:FecR-like protein
MAKTGQWSDMSERYKKQTEHNEYLWEGSGQPDTEIQRLEKALEEFRATSLVPPAFPLIEDAPRRSSWWLAITSNTWVPRFAAATLTLAAFITALVLSLRESTLPGSNSGWSVELTEAQADTSLRSGKPKRKMRMQIGETFETNRISKASIAVADIGRLELEPMTRLRLLQSAAGRKRIALDRGTIHVTIWAPPGEFVVDTPSALAVDLGCMYTLSIEEHGNGLLRTTLGWVGFESNGHESLIPAGAAAATYEESGPGLPFFEDASDVFRSAVSEFDSAKEGSEQRVAAQHILRQARPRDGLTLWHLLSRVREVDRQAVYERLSMLIPPPAGATREGILRLDPTMLDSWWNALDLGDIGLWRHWERSWTGREAQQK